MLIPILVFLFLLVGLMVWIQHLPPHVIARYKLKAAFAQVYKGLKKELKDDPEGKRLLLECRNELKRLLRAKESMRDMRELSF